MAPELPATFSTTTGWPQASLNLCAKSRPVTSVALPAVKPTTRRTGRSGQAPCAKAPVAVPEPIKAAPPIIRPRRESDAVMNFLPGFYCRAEGLSPQRVQGSVTR